MDTSVSNQFTLWYSTLLNVVDPFLPQELSTKFIMRKIQRNVATVVSAWQQINFRNMDGNKFANIVKKNLLFQMMHTIIKS